MATDREQLTITLEPVNDEVPTFIRFRRALKQLLREHGLRCRDVRNPSTWTEDRELAFAAAAEAMREAIDRGDPWSALMDPRVVALGELLERERGSDAN